MHKRTEELQLSLSSSASSSSSSSSFLPVPLVYSRLKEWSRNWTAAAFENFSNQIFHCSTTFRNIVNHLCFANIRHSDTKRKGERPRMRRERARVGVSGRERERKRGRGILHCYFGIYFFMSLFYLLCFVVVIVGYWCCVLVCLCAYLYARVLFIPFYLFIYLFSVAVLGVYNDSTLVISHGWIQFGT